MDNDLKTKTVSFENMNTESDKSLYVKPESRFENLTTHQINTLKVSSESYTKVGNDSFTQYRIQQQNKRKKSKLQKINLYYSYIPNFYLKELSYARLSVVLYTIFFSLFIVGILDVEKRFIDLDVEVLEKFFLLFFTFS